MLMGNLRSECNIVTPEENEQERDDCGAHRSDPCLRIGSRQGGDDNVGGEHSRGRSKEELATSNAVHQEGCRDCPN